MAEHGANQHTYGPLCRLAPVPQPEVDTSLTGIPAANAQFFYSSAMSLDDPLAAATATGAGAARLPLRPFAQGDNNALDKAWLALSSTEDRQTHTAARQHRIPSPSVVRSTEEKLAILVRGLAAQHYKEHALASDTSNASDASDGIGTTVRATLQGASTDLPVCCKQLAVDAAAELAAVFCPLARWQQPCLSVSQVVQRAMSVFKSSKINTSSSGNGNGSGGSRRTSLIVDVQDSRANGGVAGPRSIPQAVASGRYDMPSPRRFSPLPSTSLSSSAQGGLDTQETARTPRTPRTAGLDPDTMATTPVRPTAADDGISGTPFMRPAMPDPPASLPLGSLLRQSGNSIHQEATMKREADAPPAGDHQPKPGPTPEVLEDAGRKLDRLKTTAAVPVGVSRLHTVDLPALQMRPIYWLPVNDVAVVQRATWFYRDTMLPLEAPIANQLESLYRELRPWTDTWADELRCALDVGAAGEEKVAQPLWPAPTMRDTMKKGRRDPGPLVSSDRFCGCRCLQGAAAVTGSLEPVAVADDMEANLQDVPDAARSFASYQVVFRDGQAAFLLKPSLKPSAYYGRRPIAKICKGATVGIPVVRGFDRAAWRRMHEKQAKATAAAAAVIPWTTTSDISGPDHGLAGCPGCRAEKQRRQVSDLVLVAHGVGQKLAERVESFHFTHAISGLRRAVHVELQKAAVQAVLRPDHNGIMLLPVNWRHTVSFEDGSAAPSAAAATEPGRGGEAYSLKDIEPSSIPAVRSVISDVMFDIPFYMSHHKPRMIRALVREANRVYRLWCRNNPGFAEHGRVHLVGHSLGSAMAIEVLSRQPTVSLPLDLVAAAPHDDFFEFDTRNLFLLGSPAAFFLLLERGSLVPRRGRHKPGIHAPSDTPAGPDDLDDEDNRVVADAGFGCLAVDNIYNVLAKEDPIAYLLNGTVDTAYAASLRPAYVPSATAGLFASMGHALRGVVPGLAAAPHPAEASLLASLPADVATMVRLPSQLELEVHDFTREEIAERKAYLLNDNGQIDFTLQSGGGPLEMQYLNMLSAHTSYWTNPDLVRMLCVEIGRRPGRQHTLPAMRAVKVAKRVLV